MTTISKARRARKRHVACGGYCPAIQPGQLYYWGSQPTEVHRA